MRKRDNRYNTERQLFNQRHFYVKKTLQAINTNLYAKVAPVHIVTQEEVSSGRRRPSHFKQLHQVVKLPMDVSAH